MKLSLTILLGLSCIAIASANAATITLDTKLTTSGGTSSSLYEDFNPSTSNSNFVFTNEIGLDSANPFRFSVTLGDMHSTTTDTSFKLTSLSIIGETAKIDANLVGTFELTISINGKDYAPISSSSSSGNMGIGGNYASLNFDFSSLNLQLNSTDQISFILSTSDSNGNPSVVFNPIMAKPSKTGASIDGSQSDQYPEWSPIISIKGESIPEPSTTALAGLGLASLLLRRRRKS